MPQKRCNGNYYCDTATGFCCRNSAIAATFPQCPNGITSVALCINGGCNQGYQCNAVGTQQVCCRGTVTCSVVLYDCKKVLWLNFISVCPNNATSSGTCPTGSCAANSVCVNGLCCPDTVSVTAIIPTSLATPTTPRRTPTVTIPGSTPSIATPGSTSTIQPTGNMFQQVFEQVYQ